MSARLTHLANGLRVVTQRMPQVETVSLGVWVDAGARHEPAGLGGVAHLLEHMAFKGTHRRSARAIAEEIEAVGGHLDAYTSREFTAYQATLLRGDEALAVDVIADILQHSLFDEAELARERAVVLQEIAQAEDTPDDAIFDRFQETAFPNQPLGRPVLGAAERVASMPGEALRNHMRETYTAPCMVAAAAGNLDHDRFAGLVGAAFGDLAPAGGRGAEPARYAGGDLREPRDLEQAHILLGFEGLSWSDPDYYALSVLSTILGGGMSSRLFQEVREARGLAYDVHAFGASYRDAGLFGVYAGTGEREAAELVSLVCGLLQGVEGSVTGDELRRARAQIKAGAVMSLESTAARCDQLARQVLLFGRPVPMAEIAAHIDAVDSAALDRVSRRLFDGPPTFAALGPTGGLPPYDEIAGMLRRDA